MTRINSLARVIFINFNAQKTNANYCPLNSNLKNLSGISGLEKKTGEKYEYVSK